MEQRAAVSSRELSKCISQAHTWPDQTRVQTSGTSVIPIMSAPTRKITLDQTQRTAKMRANATTYCHNERHRISRAAVRVRMHTNEPGHTPGKFAALHTPWPTLTSTEQSTRRQTKGHRIDETRRHRLSRCTYVQRSSPRETRKSYVTVRPVKRDAVHNPTPRHARRESHTSVP